MTETLAALLFAHVLADFVFRIGSMAQDRSDRRLAALALHALIVAATLVIALGQPAPLLLELVAAHLVIDLVNSTLPRGRLWPFIADQAMHLLTLVAFAAWQPDLWQTGLWSGLLWLPGAMALVAGALITTRAGGFAVGLLMLPWAHVRLPRGLPKGGTLIGLLERGVIFVLVLVGQPGGIGFLIAAKSVLRFETTSKDTRAGEYVIIGTLASFGWALVGAYATRALLLRLPPLGILPLTP